MKSVLASLMAAIVLATGVPSMGQTQAQFPPWFCELFPMFCTRK